MTAPYGDGVAATTLVREIIESHHRKTGDVIILGVTGQAGAGKTSMSRIVQRAAQQRGLPCHTLALDVFFKLSRRGRKLWLEEPDITAEERLRREDQISWWDFAWLDQSLATLKEGKILELRDVYSREHDGELAGKITIRPHESGAVVLLDGVAILDAQHVAAFLYLQVSPEIRWRRLLGRDGHRIGDSAKKRWALTQRFERNYFPTRWEKIHYFLDNSGEDPKPLDTLHPAEALRPHPEWDI